MQILGVVNFVEIKYNGSCQERVGNYCFNGSSVTVSENKKFWKWMLVHNNVIDVSFKTAHFCCSHFNILFYIEVNQKNLQHMWIQQHALFESKLLTLQIYFIFLGCEVGLRSEYSSIYKGDIKLTKRTHNCKKQRNRT